MNVCFIWSLNSVMFGFEKFPVGGWGVETEIRVKLRLGDLRRNFLMIDKSPRRPLPWMKDDACWLI